jgi:hypothetical protein
MNLTAQEIKDTSYHRIKYWNAIFGKVMSLNKTLLQEIDIIFC